MRKHALGFGFFTYFWSPSTSERSFNMATTNPTIVTNTVMKAIAGLQVEISHVSLNAVIRLWHI